MKKLKIFICICLVIISAVTMASCSKKEVIESNITSVEIKGSGENREVRIKASFTEEFVEEHRGQKLYLIAKDLGSDSQSYTPIDETRVKDTVKFEIPFEENGKTHLNTAFVCAIVEGEGDSRKFTPVTDEMYIQNISELGDGASRPSVPSIKGLATDDIGHALYLGADHILLEVRIDKVLLEGYEQGAQSSVYGGLTYYFDGEQIEYFDKVISEASGVGARVYLQFVLGTPDKNDDKEKIDCLYFPSASSKAEYYMPNLTDKKTEGYLGAMYSFFADRYSGGEHGVAIDYIIGKNVNNGGVWNNSGSEKNAAEHYLAWVRLSHNCLVSNVSNGKIYISLDNGWRAQSNGALAYLNSFNTVSKATGNFNWGISLSYGQISGESMWASSDEYSTSFTPDSLSELGAILSTEEFSFESNQRSVIISEFALKNNKSSQNNGERRSASYAYCYYATLKHGFIDALIYSEYTDDTWGLLSSSGETTPLADTFAICSSSRAGELSYLESLIGNKWLALKGEDCFDDVTIYYGSPVSDAKTNKDNILFDFATGQNYGFAPMGDAYYNALCEYTDVEGNTGTYMSCNGGNNAWRVFYCDSIAKSALASSKHLGVTLNTESSGEDVVIIVTGTSKQTKEKLTYCAKATATSTPTEYFFDISDFAKALDSSDVSFAICTPAGENQHAGSLSVYKVALYGSSGGQFWKYLIITVIIIALVIALLFVIKIVNSQDSKKKSGGGKKAASKPKTQKAKAKKPEKKNHDTDDEDDEE